MISLITCSVNKKFLENLRESVASTIGVPYELIAVDNTILKHGICKVYNDAAAQAKYPYLCFVHEDVKFWTQNWGELMIETLQDPSVGILGICGGKYYPNVPGGWLDIPAELRRFNMTVEVNGKQNYNCVKDGDDSYLTRTVTLDGLLLAMRKTTWEQLRFNYDFVKGFEFYDIEICLRAQEKYRNVIDHRIIVEHFGTGRYNTKRWMTDALDFYDHKAIRHSVSLVSSFSVAELEDFAFKRFLERVASIDDSAWKNKIWIKLFWRFPYLALKNIPFFLGLNRRTKTTG